MTTNNTGIRTIIIAFLAFVGLGMTSGLLGLAWPSIRQQFELPLDGVNILFLLNTIAYSVASFYIGRMMSRFGSGTLLLAGSILIAACALGIAAAPAWAVLVAVGTVAGFGSGVIDAGLNLYIATYHSPRQMNWLHACFGIGITIGPLIMTFVLEQKWGWQAGYAIVGVALFSVILSFALTRREWRTDGLQTAENKPVQRERFESTLRLPVLWFTMATFLLYVGVEIGIGQWAYTLMKDARAIPPLEAGRWVSVYWGVFTGGRFFFGIIANRYPIDQILRVCLLGTVAGAVLFWWNPVPEVGFLGLIIVGLMQAPVFPMLMSNTAHRLGAIHAENAISLQMAAVGIGSAILPGMIGTIGQTFGLEFMTVAFVIMAIMAYIFQELACFAGTKQPALNRAEN